jgi:hypothetical protein
MDASSSQCSKISITGSEFRSFGMYKRASKPILINKDYGLRYYGSIVNLIDYKGEIEISSNLFYNCTYKFTGCDASPNIDNLIDQTTAWVLYKSRTHMQLRNLISIINTDHQIVIANNYFSSN